ncbi:MAG: NlpC/P60 family protein [Desulfotignum sp.]|nr:NlpC/P60 family protein [Desulfotignum sp.]
MSKFLLPITVFFLCLSMTACSHPFYSKPSKKLIVSDEKKRHLSNKETVKGRLYLQHDKWKGVKYKMGGLSKKGVDCSGFVYLTYLELFGVQLPRSTGSQSQIGKKIQTDNLRSGDLVFFKTGWKGMHVGIYLENNSFLHASTKKGVMISRLDNPYWKSRYWQTKRVGF